MNLIFLKESYYRTGVEHIQTPLFNDFPLTAKIKNSIKSTLSGQVQQKNMVLLRKGNRTMFIKRLL